MFLNIFKLYIQGRNDYSATFEKKYCARIIKIGVGINHLREVYTFSREEIRNGKLCSCGLKIQTSRR